MRESTNLYRIFAVVFSFICIALLYMNYKLLKSTYSVNTSTYILEEKKIETKKYGYTNILNILKEDDSLDILSIESKGENEDFVSIDLKFNRPVYTLIDTLEKIKLEDSFVSVENIKIDKEIQGASFTATFLISK